jgi:uncharacterized protein (TIGR00288 family)
MNNIQEVAVFWDYENVRVNAEGLKVPVAEKLVEYTKSLGHVRIKRVYSNWGVVNPAINQALYSLGFEPIHVSMGKANSVDVKIAVDCLDTAMQFPNILTYVIVTGDKDFISVVNWLRDHRKRVIIIGKSDIVSEHLLLSADHFVSLEEFTKLDEIPPDNSPDQKQKKIHLLPYDDAVQCLVAVISNTREQNKSTRFNTIDNMMRSYQDFDYRGANSVMQPNSQETYKTFTKFIAEVEKRGKIKSEIVEGFRELFLIDEDPKIESEFSEGPKSITNPEHWKMIIEIIEKKFVEIKEKFTSDYATFIYLSMGIHKEKKNYDLPYSGNILRNSLSSLIDVGLLRVQDENHLVLADEYQDKKDWYIDRIIKSKKQ